MKKWVILYVFLPGFLSLIVGGHAVSVKAATIHSSSKLVSEKKISFAGENKNDEQKDYYTHHYHTSLPFSITAYFSLGENAISVSPGYTITQTVIAVEQERLLKDHLLHLFPSHYFW